MSKTSQIRPLRYIRANFEWQNYVEEHYDVKYATNNELRINCPSCGDHKYKCYINPEKKVFHCFKCDFTTKKGGHDVFDFVALTEGITRGAATIKLLREYKPVTPEDFEAAISGALDEVPEQLKKVKLQYISGLPDVARPIQDVAPADARPFWDYLLGRGLTSDELVHLLKVHIVTDKTHPVHGLNGKLKGDIGRRVLWPLYGGDHKLVSWQARAFESSDAVKYFNAPDTDISATVWPYVAPRPGSTVILCEGVLDCAALRRLGKDFSAYACFTKHITRDQIALLKSWGVERVVLFWDQDAKREMVSAAKNLMIHFDTYVPSFAQWPVGIDSGDCLGRADGVDVLRTAVTNAISVNSVDFLRWELF